MDKHQLGTLEASEQLIKDLYINLRNEVNNWAEITFQTPQARMGYIGQHLVSVVTGYPGGKSGARGYDLVMENGNYGEIKTCYRVDQLGQCSNCGGVVSSLEKECASCGSKDIVRKDDSKWLIGIQHDEEFKHIVDPYRYYFVLFEFEEINNIENNNIVASIWEANPKSKGFGYCMMDYYLNIRSKSVSKAPFNMWPYQLKFTLTQPILIYRAVIKEDGDIETKIFPSLKNEEEEILKPLYTYSAATTLTVKAVEKLVKKYAPNADTDRKNKKKLLEMLEEIRCSQGITNGELCDAFAEEIYYPLLDYQKQKIPKHLVQYFKSLQ